MKLVCSALLKFLSGAVLLALLLFLPAGTVRYPQGWLFLALLLIPMLLLGLVQPAWLTAGAVLLFLSMPLVLGSPLSFLLFLCYPALLVKRIRNEESVLEQELPGYREYEQKVRWRLCPWVW